MLEGVKIVLRISKGGIKMEENKGNKLGLGIIIGVLVCLVIGLSAFIIYDKVLSKDKVDDSQQKVPLNKDDDNQQEVPLDKDDNKQQEVTLDYRIEGTTPNKKILVNSKYVDVTGTNIEVIGKLNDVLVIKVWSFDFYTYYVIDKNASIVSVFAGSGASTNYNATYLKGTFMGECTIENNSLIIKSDIVASEPTFISCSKNDNDIVEYTEKFTYLGNGKFSSSTLVKTTTAQQYRQNNNISCNS